MAPPAGGLAAREAPADYDARPQGHDGAALGAGGWPPAGGQAAGATPPAGEPVAAPASGDDGVQSLPPSLEQARGELEAALARLEEVELAAESGEAVRAAAVGLHRQVSRLHARLVDVLGQVDRRQAYEVDGAISAKSWFRDRVSCNPGEAGQLVTASRRLPFLPRLAAAFADGRVSLAHVAAITSAAMPGRAAAIEGLEKPLVHLAEHAEPRDVRAAVARIRDVTDLDGSESPPLPDAGPDPRRSLRVRDTVDGLSDLAGTLDALTGEWLRTLLDAFDEPDPPDTPAGERRTPAQRRHDAFHAMLTKIAAHPDTPKLAGAKPRVLAMVDVATLAGADCQATRSPQLRYAGEMTPDLARQIAEDARITAVETMGPWRPTSVGREQRTLPPWLRELMQMLHGTCCGPDCDRPATWAEVHHLQGWAADGETSIDNSGPTCPGHHDMVENGGWTLSIDPDTRIATWTSPSGKVITTRPRPP